MISWAWSIARKIVIINQHDIYNKEYNKAYDIIDEHSRHLVINLAKM